MNKPSGGVTNLNIQDLNITIVGLGLIGGSFARALKKLNPKSLRAVEVDQDIINTALDKKIIDEGYIKPEEPLKGSDLVIMCIYPTRTADFIEENMEHFKPGAVITDTAGIKVKPVKRINSVLRRDLDFIAGHPLAGREYKGFGLSSGSAFDGASYIITPTERNSEENIQAVERLVFALGVKNIIRVSPARHDEMIALTSQLPHVVAAALIGCSDRRDVFVSSAGSFMDATRVARINSRLWTELLLENSENIIKRIEDFEHSLAEIKRAIENNDSYNLGSILDRVRIKREGIVDILDKENISERSSKRGYINDISGKTDR
jgi:prephenate dehydrogenase